MTPAAVRAPAKINLRLTILAREQTGFHQIETLFALVDLADEIRIDAGAPGVRLTVEGADLGPAEHNLAVRAARAWFVAANVEPCLDIHLVKHIPAGSGLGGGSSDAAAVLAALDAAADVPLGLAPLLRIARTLGSDVSFFLHGAPYAIAWGRGERCLPISPPPDRSIVLGIADPPVSTARAYERMDPRTANEPIHWLPNARELGTWNGVARVASNDFERVLNWTCGISTPRACGSASRAARRRASASWISGSLCNAC